MNDDASPTTCITDNILPYSLRTPKALRAPEPPPLVSGQSSLRDDVARPTADQTTSSWIWSATLLAATEPVTATGATDNLHSFKRTADTADLNKGEEEQEWEIIRILGKRRTREGQEYKVRWEDTWLRRSELGNAQELLRKFDEKDRAQRGCKRGRPALADKGR